MPGFATNRGLEKPQVTHIVSSWSLDRGPRNLLFKITEGQRIHPAAKTSNRQPTAHMPSLKPTHYFFHTQGVAAVARVLVLDREVAGLYKDQARVLGELVSAQTALRLATEATDRSQGELRQVRCGLSALRPRVM